MENLVVDICGCASEAAIQAHYQGLLASQWLLFFLGGVFVGGGLGFALTALWIIKKFDLEVKK
jgi:hypothetical protein